MIKDERYFPGSDNLGLDADSAAFAVPPTKWIGMENMRIGSTDNGATKRVESIGSTILRSAILPSVTFSYHGGAEDVANKRFVYFLRNTTGPWHKIMCYYYDRDQHFTVLTAAQVTGGLNFDKDYFIHSARIVNGIVYWTDNLNPPRKVNISMGISLNHGTGQPAYTSPLSKDIITVIKRPPNYTLAVQKVFQSSPALSNNFIKLFAGKFASFYEFKDGETSVLSAHSKLVPYNIRTDTYNAVDITFQFNEVVPQDAQKVNLCVQLGNDPDFFVIKTWDKGNATDNALITSHNAGSTALTYRFYNNQTGVPLDSAYSVKPFESVPLTSKALEIVNNRLLLGNNVEGYTTPTTTSLAATVLNLTSGAGITGVVYKLVYNDGATTRYVIDVSGLGSLSGYYRYTPDDTTTPPNPSAWGSLGFVGFGATDVFRFYIPTWPSPGITSFSSTGATISITGTPSTVSLIGATCYKSGASYRIAIAFFDKWMRKCGVISNGTVYETADRSYSSVAYTTGITWSLSNSSAVSEIPDWAEYYMVLRTKCLRTSFFMQSRSKNNTNSMTYVSKDASDAYTFSTSTYSSSLYGIGVDITNLNSFGMGYQYQEGDIIKIYKSGDGTVYELKILDQQGRWVICELRDLSVLSTSTDAFFEIYTPYRESVNEAFYEVGSINPVNNPGTSVRNYSVLNGTITGDVTLLDRNTTPNNYLTENMSPSDTYWRDWFTDAGRPNFVDPIGQQLKKTNISWSNVYIPGTRSNGLSTFDPLDEKNLPDECGQIQKLSLTSKVQDEQGVVMLAICERETASLYMGEVQTYGSASLDTTFVSASIIGTVNNLKGSFGTLNPESVISFRGNVYWVDVYNGKVIQYSEAGLFPISNYDVTKFWKLYSRQFNSMTSAQIEALGNRPYIFTGIDPHHYELLISVPKLSTTPPKGFLPDYPSTIYPFDIHDLQGKTLVYKLNAQPNFWQGSYSFVSEGFVAAQNRLFSFKNGQLYEHNDTGSYNNFYGTQEKSRIMFVSNQSPDTPKVFNNISLSTNLRPTLTYFRSEEPYEQVTDLMDFDWKTLEGNLYSHLFRNKMYATHNGFLISGILLNEKMRTPALRVMIEWTVTSSQAVLRFVSLGYQLSAGHAINNQNEK